MIDCEYLKSNFTNSYPLESPDAAVGLLHAVREERGERPEAGVDRAHRRRGAWRNYISFFLEFVGYDAEGGDEKSLAYAKKKPEIVSGAMAEFGKARYNVDVLKVEVPIITEFVAGTKCFKGEAAYTRAEALRHFRDAEAMTHKPFIYLSAGVSNPVFIETLEWRASPWGMKFNGVLCGAGEGEGRHPDLRQAGRGGLPPVAGDDRR